uniref:Sodium/calcium exchanger membrane region domain-containing protein n=1 Tax=Arcella intermedia TaxID=1963864 RepID=A0A6B2L1D4_9EUKA
MNCALDSTFISFILLTLWLLYLQYILISTTHQYFGNAVAFLTESLRNLEKGSGSVFLGLTFVSGDFFISTAASYHMANDVAIGGVVGGVFLMLTIGIGLSVFLSKDKSHRFNRRPLFRDVLFMVISTITLAVFWLKNNIQIWGCVIILAVYVVYLVTIFLGRYIHQTYKNTSIKEMGIEDPDLILMNDNLHITTETDLENVLFLADMEENPSTGKSLVFNQPDDEQESAPQHFRQFWKDLIYDGSEWEEKSIIQKILFLLVVPSVIVRNLTIPTGAGISWSKPLFMLNCFASPLFLLVVTETTDLSFPTPTIQFPVWGLLLILSFIIFVVVFFTSSLNSPPKYFNFLVVLNIVMSSCWLYMVGLELVSLLITLLKLIGLSPTTGGIIFVGISNSYFAIQHVVKMSSEVFISLALPSLLSATPLKLNFCLGSAFFISSIFNSNHEIVFPAVTGQSGGEWIYGGMNALILIFISLLVVEIVFGIGIVISKFKLKTRLGVVLVGLWVVALLLLILSEVGILFGKGPILSLP